jgi:hypothetical protein
MHGALFEVAVLIRVVRREFTDTGVRQLPPLLNPHQVTRHDDGPLCIVRLRNGTIGGFIQDALTD